MGSMGDFKVFLKPFFPTSSFLKGVLEVFRGFLEGFWRVSGGCLEGVWRVSVFVLLCGIFVLENNYLKLTYI